MATFFFKFCTGKLVENDPHGLEFSDLAAAREEAFLAAREIVGNAVRFGHDDFPDQIIMADFEGKSLSIVPLVDALPRRFRRLWLLAVASLQSWHPDQVARIPLRLFA